MLDVAVNLAKHSAFAHLVLVLTSVVAGVVGFHAERPPTRLQSVVLTVLDILANRLHLT